MNSQRYDIDVQQGATFTQQVEYQIDGAPVNIEGRTARMQIRKSYDLPVVLALTTENGRIAISNTNKIDINIPAVTTAEILAGRYLYDLELVDGAAVERILLGVLSLSAEVTK